MAGEREDEFRRSGPEDESTERALHSGRERTRNMELLSGMNPDQVRYAARMMARTPEYDFYVERQQPNVYELQNMAIPRLADRITDVETTAPIWPMIQVVERGVVKDVVSPDYIADKEERKRLVNTYKSARAELSARLGLLRKLGEQEMYSGDVETYVSTYFTRYGKYDMPTAYYREMLTGIETYPGFVPFGEKVEAAFMSLLDVAEGKAQFKTRDGTVNRVPNIFAMPGNIGLQRWVVDNVVAKRLEQLRDPSRPRYDKVEITDLEHQDDVDAARLAHALFMHWDFDVVHSIAAKGGAHVDVSNMSQQEIEDIGLETGAFGKDWAKMMYIAVRQATQHGMKEPSGRREHIRAAGNPLLHGRMPVLSASALDIMTTEMRVTDEVRQKIRSAGVPEKDIKDKIKMPVMDRVRGTTGLAVDDGKGGKRLVKVDFEPCRLGEVLWDDVEPIIKPNTDPSNPPYMDFVQGVQTDGFEVPFKLQLFLAYNGIYSVAMRTDHGKLYEDMTKGGLLLKLNASIDNAINFMAPAYGLSPSTKDKLNEYVRFCLVAGTAAQASTYSAGGKEFPGNVEQIRLAQVARREAVMTSIGVAISESTFLRTSRNKVFFEGEWKNALRTAVDNMRIPLPGDFRIGNSNFFSSEELAELKPLYPLGVSSAQMRAKLPNYSAR